MQPSNSESTQCAVLQLFKFRGVNSKSWGFYQMVLARMNNLKSPGLQFFKPLGLGSGNGYRAWPNWDASGFFMVFKNIDAARDFREKSILADFIDRSAENYCIFMKPTSSRGSWSGFDQWEIQKNEDPKSPVCSLTRATLKPEFLFRFWKMVSPVSLEQKDYPGLFFSQGIGEIPLLEQATFTIWESKVPLEEFARDAFHGEAVREVYRLNGFKEQMYTRFTPILSEGSWNGKDPLSEYFQKTENQKRLQLI